MIGIAAVLAVSASLPVVDSIRIESGWGGLGEPRAATYTIVRRHDRYHADSRTVPQHLVDRFVAAITSLPVERETALRGIASPQWLAARAREPHDRLTPVCSAEAKRLFQQRLTDPSEAVRALNRHFSVSWSDDYPVVSVDVTFLNRQTIHLESQAQHALMLPWRVGNVETWNPEIPRALIDLLPAGAEPRLTDQNLARGYVEQVARDMRGAIGDLEGRCIHRGFLAAVEKQFEIVRVYEGSPGWFTAYVRRADFPPNLVLTLVIRDVDKPDALAKLDRAVQHTTAYVDLVDDYVARYPKKHFAIWSADGVSVEGDERAVRLSEYHPRSGIVSDPRIIRADGVVADDGI